MWIWSPSSLHYGVALELEWWSWHVDMTAYVDIGLIAESCLANRAVGWTRRTSPDPLVSCSVLWVCVAVAEGIALLALLSLLAPGVQPFPGNPLLLLPGNVNCTERINISLFSSQEYKFCESFCNFGQKVISLTNSDNMMWMTKETNWYFGCDPTSQPWCWDMQNRV